MKSSFKLLLLCALPCLFILSACTSKTTSERKPLDGNAIIIMPVDGSYGDYVTTHLIESFEASGFNVVSDKVVRATAYNLGFQAEHRLFPEGPSIYARTSQIAVAQKLGVQAIFVGDVDTVEISDKSFSGAYIGLQLIKVDTNKALWRSEYRPGFWTLAITAKGHIRHGAHALAERFTEYERP